MTLQFSCIFLIRYLDVIEKALAGGGTLLIENVTEKLDPVLEPLLGKNTIKKGRLVPKHNIFSVYNFNQRPKAKLCIIF